METKTFFAQDLEGNALPLAAVTVLIAGTATVADIFDEAGAPKTNPFQATTAGAIVFAAVNGAYDVLVQENGGVATQQLAGVRFFDPAEAAGAEFATAAQGAKADTALQDPTAFATAAQGAKADTALQPGNNLSDLDDPAAARASLDVPSTADLANAAPAGSVIFHAANTAPAGYLKANGALVSRTTYADLFAAIGTTFGAGDGSTTFALPDLRGEFIRGWDDGRGVDSARAFGSAQADAFQGHKMPLRWAGAGFGASGDEMTQGAGGVGGATVTGSYINSNAIGTTGPQVLSDNPYSDGTNGTPRTAAETRPRNIALLACIKF